MDLVHLFLDVVPVEVADLRGEQAVLGVRKLGAGIVVAERRIDLVTHHLVEALGRRRQGPEILITVLVLATFPPLSTTMLLPSTRLPTTS